MDRCWILNPLQALLRSRMFGQTFRQMTWAAELNQEGRLLGDLLRRSRRPLGGRRRSRQPLISHELHDCSKTDLWEIRRAQTGRLVQLRRKLEIVFSGE